MDGKTEKSKPRHPWGGYRIEADKRGHRRWRYRIVNKFHTTVFTSDFRFPTQAEARSNGTIHKRTQPLE